LDAIVRHFPWSTWSPQRLLGGDGAFQFEEVAFSGQAARVPGEAAVGADDAVAGDEDPRRVVPDMPAEVAA
jgi:hypothetical protein